jgi:hypothetical protein
VRGREGLARNDTLSLDESARLFEALVVGGLLLLWNVVNSGVAACADLDLAGDAEQIAQRARTGCGLYSLYVMLRFHGYEVSDTDLTRAVHIDDKGSSFLDLQRAASAFGMKSCVYKCELADLARRDYEGVIVLIHQEGGCAIDEGIKKAAPVMGHFVTLVGYDPIEKRILAIDDNFKEVQRYSEEDFHDVWSGYAMMPVIPTEGGVSSAELALALSLATFVGLLVWRLVGVRCAPRPDVAGVRDS